MADLQDALIVNNEIASLQIARDNTVQLRIDLDGRVYWRRGGELVQAQVDADLAQAFLYVVITMTGLPAADLIERIRSGESDLRPASAEDSRYEGAPY